MSLSPTALQSLRAIVGRAETIADFEAQAVDAVEVALRRREIKVALDGEVVSLATPLRYSIRVGALAVVRPGRAAIEAGREAAA